MAVVEREQTVTEVLIEHKESQFEQTLQQVREAAAVLDEFGPDNWRDRIDLDYLDMSDGYCCVIAQAYKPEWEHMNSTYSIGTSPYGYGMNELREKGADTRKLDQACNGTLFTPQQEAWEEYLSE